MSLTSILVKRKNDLIDFKQEIINQGASNIVSWLQANRDRIPLELRKQWGCLSHDGKLDVLMQAARLGAIAESGPYGNIGEAFQSASIPYFIYLKTIIKGSANLILEFN